MGRDGPSSITNNGEFMCCWASTEVNGTKPRPIKKETIAGECKEFRLTGLKLLERNKPISLVCYNPAVKRTWLT